MQNQRMLREWLVLIGTIDLPDGLIVEPRDLGILLPSNWNARPVAPDSRSIAREFLSAIAGTKVASRPIGLRVPSVLSNSDHNVLIDPSRKDLCIASVTLRAQAPCMGTSTRRERSDRP